MGCGPGAARVCHIRTLKCAAQVDHNHLCMGTAPSLSPSSRRRATCPRDHCWAQWVPGAQLFAEGTEGTHSRGQTVPMGVPLTAEEAVRVGGRWVTVGGAGPPGVAGPKAESGDASPRTGNPGVPSQAVRNVYLSRWEDRASFIYQFVSVMDNSGIWRHMLCAAPAAGAPPTAPGPHHSGAFSLTSNC